MSIYISTALHLWDYMWA